MRASIVLVLALAHAGCNRDGLARATADHTSPPERLTGGSPQVTLYVVDAKQLVADYVANEVAADAKHKGKLLYVRGTATAIKRDITNKAFILLAGGQPITSVECIFEKDRESQAAEVMKGQDVALLGRCDGLFGHVILKDCRVMKEEP